MKSNVANNLEILDHTSDKATVFVNTFFTFLESMKVVLTWEIDVYETIWRLPACCLLFLPLEALICNH